MGSGVLDDTGRRLAFVEVGSDRNRRAGGFVTQVSEVGFGLGSYVGREVAEGGEAGDGLEERRRFDDV